jgi:formylglycine-generating enzyme required for sulfatase activity
MGSPETEYDRSANESPQTQVTFTNGFWMERFEVTEGEFAAIMGTNFTFLYSNDTNQPMDEITWFDASNYCAGLTVREQAAGRVPAGYVYRLPTEAEWEYVCRAGTTTRFPFGDDHSYTLLLNYAWIATNSLAMTHDVGGKLPNPWGVYDMSGNVWEWCADFYGPYSGLSVTNPVGPASGAYVVMRGGSSFYNGDDARSAARNYNSPTFFSHGIGIRVVLGPPLH